MRAWAGPVMLLVMVLGFTGYRMTHKPDTPGRDFTELELAGPQSDSDGTCYSLSTVLIANGVFGNAPRTWKRAGGDKWTLTLERVIQGYNGPAREFTTWTFEKAGGVVRLAAVDASRGLPNETTASIDQLVYAPNARHSTPVERCVDPGARGYKFERK